MAAAYVSAAPGRVWAWSKTLPGRSWAYIKVMAGDYRTAAIECAQDCVDHKVRSTFMFAGVGFAGYAYRTNPTLEHYVETLVDRRHVLCVLGSTERNQRCADLISRRSLEVDQKKLQHYSLVLCSILLPVDAGTENSLYEAQCSATLPRWRDIPYRILDVGFCGRWIYLDREFVDFDISEETLALSDGKDE